MSFEITIMDDEIKGILSGLSGENLRTALEDAGQIVINSTKAGFLKQIGPDGKKWSENPSWYKTMKRGAAVLTGPTSKSIGGVLAGKYEFAQINLTRMKNSLRKKVSTVNTEVVIDYLPGAQKRARATDLGDEAKMILKSVGGDKIITMTVNIEPRKHLAIAENYARLGYKDDIAHILEVFEGLVDNHFE
jgi:hypothetical protein